MILEGVGLFAVRVLTLVSLTVLLSEAVARVGAGVLPLIYQRSVGRPAAGKALERFGLGLLLGWACLGFAHLGLALTGLCTPLVVVGVGVAFLVASRAMWEPRFLLVAAAAEGRTLGRGGLVVLALGFIPAVFYLLMPEGQHDVWTYHLGVPWQYLQAGRSVLEHTALMFHFPLTMEMAFILPLIFGDDRLAKGMVLSCFTAVSAVFASRCLQAGRPASGWLGPLLALSSSQVLFLIGTCKSDIPAASLFVTGALLQLAGAWAPGVFLLGLCVASKLVYGPIIAVWCLGFLPSVMSTKGKFSFGNIKWKRLAWWAVLLVLPLVPWLVKAWLATGNPIYPFASGIIPSFDWSGPNREAFRLSRATNIPDGYLLLANWPAGLKQLWWWFTSLSKTHLLVLLFLPGLLLLRRYRRAALACLVAQIVLLAVIPYDRYFLPSAWLLYFLIAEETGRLPWRYQPMATWALAVYAIVRIGLAPETAAIRTQWKDAFRPWAQVLERHHTTFLDVERLLKKYGVSAVSWRPGAPRPPRVLSIGEWRTYKFPGRMIFNGMFGETPVVWKMVKGSRDLPELRKKFRQLGAKRLLYNYVTVDWASLRYGSFPWDQRSIRLYIEFCKQHLEILGRTEKCDFQNGGFYVYEIRDQPRQPAPSTVWFAPGTESVYGTGIRLENLQRKEEALQAYLKAFEMLPDVGHAWNLVGHAYALLNDPANAFRYLREFGEAGMMDSMNLGEFGAYAVRTGQLDLGERVLADALNRYPQHRHQILINQAVWNGQKAVQAFNSKQVDTTEKYVEQGLTIMAEVPETVSVANKPARRTTLAFLLGMRAEVCLVRGQRTQAAKWFTEAAQLAPEVPMAPRWKALAAELGPRLFGGPGPGRG